MIHSNPSKIVKRWLGTSSGVYSGVYSGVSGSGKISKLTLGDISTTAQTLLDPAGLCATGRDILVQLAPPSSSEKMDTTMETDGNDEKKEEEGGQYGYVEASCRELEAYLFSLAVRILWSKGGASFSQALDLSIKGVQVVSTHINEAEASPHTTTGTITGSGSASGLFPLLARLYRYQALVAESMGMGNILMVQTAKREELVHAHRMAVMRRDVDTQATLLNLMLRDLLSADQGEYS